MEFNKWIMNLVLGALLAAGCARDRSGSGTATAEQAATELPADVAQSELEKRAQQFAQLSRRLPGRSEQEHRALMADVFRQLHDTLPLIKPQDQNGGFEQQRAMLMNASDRL